MSSVGDFNQRIIEEFRANAGVPPSWSGSSPLLLLHHRGAKTGADRVNPVAFLEDEGRYVIFASKAGAPTNPDWYHNLVANPDTVIEVGNETIPVTARVADGEERDRIWSEQKRRAPGFAEYENTSGGRTIPVVLLEPKG